jgi:hypothetical protein
MDIYIYREFLLFLLSSITNDDNIPAVKQVIQNVFDKAPMTTMNVDESVKVLHVIVH